jgi:trk system potassium uptake protein TrkH
MRLPTILDGLGLILAIFSLAFLAPIWTGVWYDEPGGRLVLAYGVPIAICLTLGLGLRALMHGRYEQIRSGEALVLVALAWMAVALVSAIPFLGIGVLDSPVDAFFESMSGFTSTGATVITGLDEAPKSILLWRAMSQWLGGMGVIVLSVAVLSRFFGGGAAALIMRAEAAGHTVSRMAPRIAQTARLLWGIYMLFTIAEVAMLLLVGRVVGKEVTLFDAVCHAFATLPGGGFGTHDNNVAYWNSPAIESVLVIFMLAGATSFLLHYRALHLDWRAYLRDPEFRFWMMVIALAIVFVTGDLAVRGIYTVDASFRYSVFNVVSLITTTGFTNVDYNLWPASSQLVLLSLIIMGSMMGSTSGALKMTRVMIMLKSVRVLVSKLIHPHAVVRVKLGNIVITDEHVANTGTYVLLYLATIFIGTVLVSLAGVDIVTSLGSAVTCLGTTGPGLGITGPVSTFATLPAFSKLVLTFLMWFGRLEILGCLLLFSPSLVKE